MKTVRKGRKVFAVLLAFVMLFMTNTTVYAASGSQQKSASGKVTVALAGGSSGSSNMVTFNFSSLPSNAVVTKIVVSAPLSKHQGTNAIILDSFYIGSPMQGGGYFAAPSNGTLTTYAFAGASAKGTWSFFLTASCVSSGIPPYWAPYFDPVPIYYPIYSSNVYYPVKMTIYYTY